MQGRSQGEEGLGGEGAERLPGIVTRRLILRRRIEGVNGEGEGTVDDLPALPEVTDEDRQEFPTRAERIGAQQTEMLRRSQG